MRFSPTAGWNESGSCRRLKKDTGMAQIQLTSIPIVTIIVCIVLGMTTLSGAVRGFVRKISGIVSFALAFILVTALLPVVTNWLHTTPAYEFVRQQCETIGEKLVSQSMTAVLGESAAGSSVTISDGGSLVPGGGLPEGTDVSSVIDSVRAEDGSGALDRGKIKAQLGAAGYDPSIIDSMSDAELEGYAQRIMGVSAGMAGPAFLSVKGALWPGEAFLYSTGLLAEGGAFSPEESGGSQEGSSLLSAVSAGMDRAGQMRFIESLPLPQPIKDQMETFNNEDGYLKLNAKDFGSYVVNYIASLVMHALSYAATLLVVWLIIRLVLGALSVFRHLPVFGYADHLLGLLLGLVQGLLIVWGLFLVLSLFAATQAGAQLMNEIHGSAFLSTLYNLNPFLYSAAGAIKGIM